MSTLPDHVLQRPLALVRVGPGFNMVHNVLIDLIFAAVSAECATARPVRSSMAGRKSGAVPFSALRSCPVTIGLYHHPEFIGLIEQAIQCKGLRPLPPEQMHACSLLVYEQEGDQIGYHYDWNHFKGTTCTVLLTITNQDASTLLNSSNSTCIWTDGSEKCWQTQLNSLVIMQGDRVLHRARPLKKGERRVVLSMVYSTDPSQTLVHAVRQRVKDWSFGF